MSAYTETRDLIIEMMFEGSADAECELVDRSNEILQQIYDLQSEREKIVQALIHRQGQGR